MLFFQESVPVSFLGAFDITRNAGWIYNEYRNSYWTLSIRLTGETEFYIDGNTLRVGKGEILMIPPNLIYSQYTEGEHIYALHFDALKSLNVETLQKQTLKDWNSICKLFKEMYTYYTERPKGWFYKASALLYELLDLLHTETDFTESRITDNLDIAVEYLEKHYTNPALTVAELADISGYSEAYFRRQFYGRFGTTPSSRIDHLRIERAKRLLEAKKHTMAEIAERIGVPDPKYFSTWFKKHTGVSPKDYTNSLVG